MFTEYILCARLSAEHYGYKSEEYPFLSSRNLQFSEKKQTFKVKTTIVIIIKICTYLKGNPKVRFVYFTEVQ